MTEMIPVALAADNAGDPLFIDAAGDTLLAYYEGVYPQAPAAPVHAWSDYLTVALALMPRGRVWPKWVGATQAMVLGGLVWIFTRLDAAAAALLADAFPPVTINLLPEWEESLGLPDPCAGSAPTLQVRQAQVLARFANVGGQSVPYFISLAFQLGYVITITEYGSGNPHHWQVNCPALQTIYFRAGQSSAGDPLVSGGSAVLECIFNELKPAQTTISYVYG